MKDNVKTTVKENVARYNLDANENIVGSTYNGQLVFAYRCHMIPGDLLAHILKNGYERELAVFLKLSEVFVHKHFAHKDKASKRTTFFKELGLKLGMPHGMLLKSVKTLISLGLIKVEYTYRNKKVSYWLLGRRALFANRLKYGRFGSKERVWHSDRRYKSTYSGNQIGLVKIAKGLPIDDLRLAIKWYLAVSVIKSQRKIIDEKVNLLEKTTGGSFLKPGDMSKLEARHSFNGYTLQTDGYLRLTNERLLELLGTNYTGLIKFKKHCQSWYGLLPLQGITEHCKDVSYNTLLQMKRAGSVPEHAYLSGDGIVRSNDCTKYMNRLLNLYTEDVRTLFSKKDYPYFELIKKEIFKEAKGNVGFELSFVDFNNKVVYRTYEQFNEIDLIHFAKYTMDEHRRRAHQAEEDMRLREIERRTAIKKEKGEDLTVSYVSKYYITRAINPVLSPDAISALNANYPGLDMRVEISYDINDYFTKLSFVSPVTKLPKTIKFIGEFNQIDAGDFIMDKFIEMSMFKREVESYRHDSARDLNVVVNVDKFLYEKKTGDIVRVVSTGRLLKIYKGFRYYKEKAGRMSYITARIPNRTCYTYVTNADNSTKTHTNKYTNFIRVEIDKKHTFPREFRDAVKKKFEERKLQNIEAEKARLAKVEN